MKPFALGVLLAASASCAVVPSASSPTTAPQAVDLQGGGVGVWARHENEELGEITTDVLLNGIKIGKVDVDDVERKRTRVGARVGPDEVGLSFGLLAEEFADDFDLYGGALGVDGQLILSEGEVGGWFLDYDGALVVVVGDGDVPVFDAGTGALLGTVDQDLAYAELQGRLGAGVDLHGIQPMAGFLFSSLGGTFDAGGGGDGHIEGTNFGLFAGIGLRFDRIQGRVEYRVGDIDGFAVAFGIRF